MTLALLLAGSRDELEADFQEIYGLDLGGMGSDYTVAHAAALASQLPPHSRCAVKADPDAAWSDERAVLERIDYHLRHLIWMQSKDGATGRNRPEPPRTPSQLRTVGDRIKQTQLNKAEVDRILGMGSA